jgi:hypothetical protein
MSYKFNPLTGQLDLAGGGSSDLVNDTTPQLGGDLDSNGHDIQMANTDVLQFGNNQMQIYGDTGSIGQGALLFTGSNPDFQRSLYFSGSFSIYSHAGATGSGISAPEFTMLDAEAYIRANGVTGAVFSIDMDGGMRLRSNSWYGTIQAEDLTGARTYQLPDMDGTFATEGYVNDIGGWAPAPASSSDTGTAGMKAFDSTYLYICVDTDTWKRVLLSTW